jgi:hypothetical protein
MALIDDLVAYWKMDEASGNAIDAHAANDLTDNNGVGTGTGKINGGRAFTRASSHYLSSGLVPSLPMSISVWFSLAATAINVNIVGGGQALSDNNAWGLYVNSSDILGFFASDGSASPDIMTGGGGLSASTLYHAVCVWRSATDRELYLNTSSVDTSSVNRTLSASNDRFTIGTYAGGTLGDYMGGVIDEVGIWNRALTTTEISDLYNGGSGLSYDNFSGGATGNPWHYYAQL